ncbi:MAG: PIN domain-containing protein [Proteobacteria bacterium]|nr:PIN domain-containing protein [Burkholderiales bacterium]MCA0312185.1 PIN domain-containing protein [Pseudomonadota bacterium]
MARFSVIFDACVLYPAPLRDCLLRLALTDLFKARWSDHIHAEWMAALARTGRIAPERLERVRTLMDAHVRDAKVTGYESLIDALELPDPDDRHVLAAAIRCNADAIVTFNLKDFPAQALAPFGIETIHPDDFISYQIDLAPALCLRALREQRLALKHPPLDVEAFLAALLRQELPQTVSRLRELKEFL